MRDKKLSKENVAEILALTPMQEGMLFLYLKNRDTDLYFEQLSLCVTGKIDRRQFEKAWNFVIANNEMLGTFFNWEKVKNPVQIVLKKFTIKPVYIDLSGKAGKEAGASLEEIKTRDRALKFDLRRVPFRVTLCRVAKEEYVIIISYHHILFDGWSSGIILHEFFAAYHDLANKKELVKLKKTGFREFVKENQGGHKEKQKEFWRDYLSGFTTLTEISIKKLVKESVREAENLNIELPGKIAKGLEKFAGDRKVTMAAVLYTAYGVLLQKYNNRSDVVFGTTVSGRSAGIKGVEDIVGLFINTLPLRVQNRGNETIENVLHRVNDELQKRKEYENTPLVDINKYGAADRNAELFDSIVVIENYPLDRGLLGKEVELTLNSYSMFERTHYDLTLQISTFAGIKLEFVYNPRLFVRKSIENFSRHFIFLLENIFRNPEMEIKKVFLLSEQEKRQILVDFNAGDAGWSLEKTIHQLYEEQVEKTPDNISVVAGAKHSPLKQKENASPLHAIHLSYQQLQVRVDHLVGVLVEKGIEPGAVAGIMTDRSIEMVLGIFAILQAGGAYLPIDPAYPQERKDYILRDSSAKVLLTTRSIYEEVEKFRSLEVEKVFLEESGTGVGVRPTVPLDQECRGEPCVRPSAAVPSEPATCSLQPVTSSSNSAYIIYTSGSTGKPKGVAVEHRSVVNILYALQTEFPLTEADAYLLKTSYLFDVSVAELFGWYMAGGRLAILEKDGEKDPDRILTAIERNRVTHINFVPSMFNVFVEGLDIESISKLSTLKYIFLAGEALLPGLVDRFRQFDTHTRLENIYGPTEGTVYSSRYSLSLWQAGEIVPIGKPLQNIKLYILDKDDNLLPPGVPGELCIAGENLARGYLNRPELTSERFASGGQGAFLKNRPLHPQKTFVNEQGCRGEPCVPPQSIFYKTGDLARWLPDGNIEYLGRMDYQVKIRGFRVELGEIESRLSSHKNIKEAVVLALDAEPGEKYLSAYIVGARRAVPADLESRGEPCGRPEGSDFDTAEIREYLSQNLPGYMIPAHFVKLEKIPLTPNGKIDRKALLSTGTKLGSGVEYAPPTKDIEKKIARVWSELLKAEKVGIHDNFFDIGGNSLAIIRLSSRLSAALKRDIPVVTLFNYPTIAALTGYLSGEEKPRPGTAKREKTGSKDTLNRDIAVIGMAGRFPGAKNIAEFWHNLKEGKETITLHPDEVLRDLGVEDHLINNPDFVPAKGILDNKEFFDASFFGYLPAEAEIMDPQLRVFHECCWEALEDAGYCMETYEGKIGLYAGATPNPYWEVLPLESNKSYSEQWSAIQLSDKDYLATRIGYKLDFKGPCVTLQTACSTSLVAVDQACQALLSGRCDAALAGGISITFQDEAGYLYQEGTIMSPDGHCRAFDAGANGTVGGNGAGVVVLKPLGDAVSAGDNIYAVVKGSALNNDGKDKVGFTAPGVEGQAKVIRAALNAAGVEPETITYIETHGTGTPLGDPIEIAGLKKAFDYNETLKKSYCGLGSVKTNIGHLDAAAGIAGFIKTVLALKYKTIPPSLHFKTASPALGLSDSPFYVNAELKPWDNGDYPLRAGVSSFGLGGTNVHVILEEYKPGICISKRETNTNDQNTNTQNTPPTTKVFGIPKPFLQKGFWPPEAEESEANRASTPGLILLSAKTEPVLNKMSENLAEYFKENRNINLRDAAYTLQVGRSEFEYRRAVLCRDVADAVWALSSRDSGKLPAYVPGVDNKPVIFMFSGQGSQYVDMGLDLYLEERVFREEMERCFDILKQSAGYDIKNILYPTLADQQVSSAKDAGSAAEINDVFYSGPIKFIFEYSLARLLMAWGIKPYAIIGHSFGEYVVACLAGVFSLEDALKLAVLRGQVMEKTAPGAMLSVSLPEEELAPQLNKHKELSLAAVNSPSLCIVTGPTAAVAAFEKELDESGHDSIRVNFPRASHSHMMIPAAAEFREEAEQVTFHPPEIPYISGLSGGWIREDEAMSPAYWSRHLCETIRFYNGLTQLLKEPEAIFVEVGPGRGLTLFLNQHPDRTAKHKDINLVRHKNEEVSDIYYTYSRIGELWSSGVKIDWPAFYAREKRYRISLPTYPFEQQRYRVNPEPGRIQSEKRKDIKDWFYLPSWKRANDNFIADMFARHDYLLFEDECGFASRLGGYLKSKGHNVISVSIGSIFRKVDHEQYIMNPAEVSGYDKLFHDLKEAGKPFDKILHCWGITAGILTESGQENVAAALDPGFFSLIELAKFLGKFADEKVDLYVLTNFVQDVTGEERLCALKSTLLAAVKVIPKEYPHVNCRGIDINLPQGTGYDNRILTQLEREFMLNSKDSWIAYRGKHRWLPCYEPIMLGKPAQEPGRLRKGGVYLITGGTGGIGLTLSAFLAKNYQAKLILTARSEFPEQEAWQSKENDTKIKKLLELERCGGEVYVKSADVSDAAQMRQVVSEAEKRFGPINGVIHAAGIPGGGIIELRSRRDMESVLKPKVQGTLVLHEIFKDRELDFHIFCSSLSALTAPFAQVDYCAANIFLDTFARQQYSQGRTNIVSINWNTWKEVGMAVDAIAELEKKYGQMQDHSLFENDILPVEAVDVFTRILRETQPQVIVSSKELDSFIKKSGAVEDSLQNEGLPELGYAEPVRKERPELSTGYAAPGSNIEETLSAVWQDFFGIEGIGINDNFFELGGDSLKAVIVISMIHKSLAVKIPLKEFFSDPTIVGLARYLTASQESTFSAINPVEKREFYSLSSAQKRMYALSLLEKEVTVYNVPFVLTLAGKIDGKRFEEVFRNLIVRHESYRTSFDIIEGEPVQRIQDPEDIEFAIEFDEIDRKQEKSGIPSPVGANLVFAREPDHFIKKFIRPFDLTKAPLLRVGLIKTGAEAVPNILMVDMPHIVADGTSVGIIAKEFMSLYNNEVLTETRIKYRDFADWQNREKENEIIKQQTAYWLEEFSGYIPTLDLPVDFLRPKVRSFAGQKTVFELAPGKSAALKELAKTGDTTLFMVLLSIYAIFLAKITGQEEILIGTPVAGRRHADLQNVIGMFVNTLVLRAYPGGEKSYREFLKGLKDRSIAAFENQDCQFEDLVEKTGIRGDPGRNPIFDIIFAFQSLDIPEVEIQGLKLKPYTFDSGIAKFDLSLIVEEFAGVLNFTIEYSSKLFKAETIDRFVSYFKNVLSFVVIDPDVQISEIEIINDDEKRKVLVDFNDTSIEYPRQDRIDRLFAGQVEKTPDNIVLIGPAAGTLQSAHLTYRELNREADRLAEILIEKGIKPDTIAGLLLERSIKLIIGILGILKSGGAYLPIAPAYPQERKDYILRDSSAKVLLTTRSVYEEVEKLRSLKVDAIFIEEVETINNEECRGEPCVRPSEITSQLLSSSNLAYIIYTSGSTGNPKGAGVAHRSLINLCRWHCRYFQVTEADNAAQYAGIGFDASVWEIFPYLIKGAALHIISDEIKFDVKKLNYYFESNDITIGFLPTQMCEQFFDMGNSSLRVLLTGGDKLKMFKKGGYLLYNNYGPTENTVVTSSFPVDEYRDNIPIGKPIDNNKIFILDKDCLHLQPIGLAGELCIAGDSLARGYLNNPELTAEKFATGGQGAAFNDQLSMINQQLIICDEKTMHHTLYPTMSPPKRFPTHVGPCTPQKTFVDEQGRRGEPCVPPHNLLYKTGDLARWLPDGNIEFLGRIDFQVKIRGYRIELEEIGNQLLKHKAIKEAIVIDRETETGEKYLCAYIVARHTAKSAKSVGANLVFAREPDEEITPEEANLVFARDSGQKELREFLSRTLPGYMIPSYFIFLEKVPLTANGKVDRQALPVPGISAPGINYAAPRNQIEKKLVEIWSEVLNVKPEAVGIDDDFFELGGHSLKAASMTAKAHKELKIKLQVADIFSLSTIRKISEHIKKKAGKGCYGDKFTALELVEKRGFYPLSSAQERLYILHQFDPGSIAYNIPAFFRVEGSIVRETLEDVIAKLIFRHDSLRASFRMIESEPVQVIHNPEDIQFEIEYYEDLGANLVSAREPDQPALKFIRSFDLAKAPLFRTGLIKIGAAEHILMFDVHHIAVDGTSLAVLIDEFSALYQGNQLPEVKIQYKDYIYWSRDEKESGKLKELEKFWLEQFPGEIPLLNLPLDYERSARPDFSGHTISFEFGTAEAGVLQAVVEEQGVTLYMLLLSIFNVLLFYLSGQEDIVIGTPTAGRNHADLGQAVGMFVNTLALRNLPSGDKSFRQFLQEVRQNTLSAFGNQDYPFENLVDHPSIRKGLDLSRNPLFDVMLVQQNVQMSGFDIAGLQFKTLKIKPGTAKFDLTLFAEERENKIGFDLEYNIKLFNQATIRRFIAYFGNMTASLMKNPDLKISRLEVMSPEEKRRLLYEYNDSQSSYPAEKTLHRLFAEQAVRTPDNIALIGPAPGPRHPESRQPESAHLTYRELNREADRLAVVLIEKGVKPDTIVGLLLERSIELIVGILGILKSGGAYLPIDLDYPQERKEYILRDSNAQLLLTTQELFAEVEEFSSRGEALLFCSGNECFALTCVRPYVYPETSLGARRAVPSALATCNLQPVTSSSNLAYIIYTSGSTGRPKGVLLEHRAVVNYVLFAIKNYVAEEKVDFPLYTSISFDLTVTSVFTPLLSGNGIIIYSKEDKELLIEKILQENRVGVIKLTPAHLKVVREHKFSSACRVKRLILGGEDLESGLAHEIVQKFPGKVEIYNEYGPTEAAVGCMIYRFDPVKDTRKSVPIGIPADNVKIYVLNKYLEPVPPGVTGEIFISGAGIARGYLKKPELTGEKFLLDPFVPGLRMYRSGDLGRMLPDGNLEFSGRSDQQVKIRGFRVELGEIESRLLQYKKIKQAVVLVRGDEKREKHICAYIVPRCEETELPGEILNSKELRQYLLKTLPDYMVPAHFLQVDRIPLTPNGKIDHKVLLLTGKELHTGREYVSPRSDIEKTITNIWKDLLQLERVGIHDNFFDIGGNSLNLVRLGSKLSEVFQKDIPVVNLFNYTTIASLAGYLSPQEEVIKEVVNKYDAAAAADEGKWERGREIAIIGMACRFPGARNIDQFWSNLEKGVESVAFFSGEELAEMGLKEKEIADPGYVKAKAVLQDFDCFDASFFGYTPREAVIMDPQVRIFHECVWEALEDAGYEPQTYEGLIGLYAGASPNPYWELLSVSSREIGSFDQWQAFHLSNKDFMVTQISYKLNLKGTAVAVQTACSTSLVAVDLACRGISSGVCNMALAGGVTIALQDQSGYIYQEDRVMSPDGHCRAFDACARGTTAGNGAGVVVLKSLRQAVKDRDNIYAVIKGTAANNDGKRKVGYTAPSIAGQVEVIRAAHRAAGVEAGSISYIEAHGTGTKLGDPIEMEALRQVFNTDKRCICGIGSVKTNFGHLDAAAGAAGLIKTALALKNREIPPSLHFKTPNPEIDFENSPFYVNRELKEWPGGKYPLRAGVSSLGIGGTNVHVILEEWPGAHSSNPERKVQSAEQRVSSADPVGANLVFARDALILLSARTRSALEQAAGNLKTYLEENRDVNIADAAFTLQVGRRAFKHRRVLICSDVDDALAGLSSAQKREKGYFFAKEDNRPIIFMFSGHGSQYVNMGLELYREESFFRKEMDKCFDILRPIMGCDIKKFLYPPAHKEDIEEAEEKIKQFFFSSPLKFVFEYSLARLLMHWGIKPDAMIGHSFGEYATACLSGVFSLEDGITLAALRGKLMHSVPEGTMMGVPLSEDQLKPYLDQSVSLAAINGLSQCIVSGPKDAVASFEKRLQEEFKDIECVLLRIPRASHSAMMDSILDELEAKVRQLNLNSPQIPYISGLKGTWIKAEEAADPGYWALHLRETNRFADGLSELLKMENAIFIQVGADRNLCSLVNQHPHSKKENLALNLIRHPKDKDSDIYYILDKIGQLWLNGIEIDWQGFYAEEERYRVSLPTYPFKGQRYKPEHDPAKTGMDILTQSTLFSREQDIDNWFYTPTWKSSLLPITGTEKKSISSPYLVFADSNPIAGKLVQRLELEGIDVICVKIGREFRERGAKLFRINPEEGADYDRLFAMLKRMNQVPRNIIHLWNVTGNKHETSILKRIDNSQNLGYFSLLHLAQAIGKQEFGRDFHFRLMVVTDRMQEVPAYAADCPEKATILGPVRVVPLEYPNISCRSIDILIPEVGSSREEKLIDNLLNEFAADVPEQVISYCGNHRLVQCFEPAVLNTGPETNLRLKKEGVYLITGGTGGIGLQLAEYLARQVQAKLILTGRTSFPEKEVWQEWLDTHEKDDSISHKIRRVWQMEELGAEVKICCADVSQLQEMRKVIIEAEKCFGSIIGVIHSAGIPDGTMIQLRTREASEKVFVSKIKGTLMLDELMCDKKLDFFVLCSSLSAITAPFGQVAYCAANTFLDYFAHYRSLARGKLTISINWDRWKSIGMAIIPEREHKKLTGEELEGGIEPHEALTVFNRILGMNLPQVVVSTGDLQQIIDNLKTVRESNLFLEENLAGKTTGEPLHQRPDLSSDYAAPESEIEQMLSRIYQELFGVEQVGINDDFFELGGDSLKAMTIIAKIHKRLEVEVPLAEVFSRPTIAELAAYIENKGKRSFCLKIEPVEIKEYYPLSSAQKRMFILNRLEAGRSGYHVTELAILEGEIEREKLEWTFEQLIKRHESLRTSFEMEGDEPIQKIHKSKDIEFNIEYYDLQAPQTVTGTIEYFIRPFDLSKSPILRVGFIDARAVEDAGPSPYILMVDMHHIISDGISSNLLIKEFMSLYMGEELFPLRVQYKDYAEWKNRPGEYETVNQQEQYWLQQFAGEIPILNLPLDYDRPAIWSFEGKSVGFAIGEMETALLNRVSQDQGVSLYMLLLAIYNVFLAKISSQEDIVIGSPTAGRRHADLEAVVGMFVNTIGLRNYPRGEKSFRDFLKEVRERTIAAFENQDFQFEELVEKLSVNRDTSRSPIFDVMFVLQNMDSPELEITGLKLTPYEFENRPARFDLTLQGFEAGGKLQFSLGYSTNLFNSETIRRFINYFRLVMSSVLDDCDRKLFEIEIQTEEEKKKLLFDFNDTQAEYPRDKTVDLLFAEQATRTADSIAVVGPVPGPRHPESRQPESTHLSYGELKREAVRLAGVLIEKGIKSGTIVGIMVERSIDMIIGILAILTAGGAYLPMDQENPGERIAFMIADSDAQLILTHGLSKEVEKLRSLQVEKVFIEDCRGEPCVRPSGKTGVGARRAVPLEPATCNLQPATSSLNLAYIIYTSGSTGQPKGVLVSHGNVVNVVTWFARKYNLGPGFRVLQMSDYTFDASVNQFFGTLLHGAELHIIDRNLLLNVTALRQYIEERGINLVNFVPLLLKELLCNREPLASLKVVITGGEKLEESTKDGILDKGYSLYNQYGPTEATIDALVAKCSQARVNLGTPIANAKCYILDRYLKLLPIGITGELYIAGAGLARGYLNRPGLTADNFLINSFKLDKPFRSNGTGITGKIYKTGDLGRWLPDGSIEFLGRVDYQVKVRGFRIELGEIESELLKHDSIKETVVIVRDDGENENHICAYLVVDDLRPGNYDKSRASGVSGIDMITSTELREFLSNTLPDYMIPAHFSWVEKIPLTSTGKVDRKALISLGEKLEAGMEYVAPQKENEKIIARIWQEVLSLEKVGIHDNFFDLGGNSLQLVTVNERLKKVFEIDIPAAKMFRYPTINSLLSFINKEEGSTISEERIEESVDQMEETMHMLLGEGDE